MKNIPELKIWSYQHKSLYADAARGNADVVPARSATWGHFPKQIASGLVG